MASTQHETTIEVIRSGIFTSADTEGEPAARPGVFVRERERREGERGGKMEKGNERGVVVVIETEVHTERDLFWSCSGV